MATEWGLSRRLARGARHSVEKLSWNREIERLDRSYREVIESARGVRVGNASAAAVNY
jgi:hypothetical protein